MNNIINETWLSNHLAWLLDPNETHYLEDKFSNSFLDYVLGDEFKKIKAKHELDLKDFEVCREFYLQVKPSEKTRKPRFLDIVFMDLSKKVVVVIENKKDGDNSKNQLSEYMQIKDLFLGCEIFYIYLTYEPKEFNFSNLHEDKKEEVIQTYKKASWTEEVRSILKSFSLQSYEIFKLYQLLNKDPIVEADFTLEELNTISVEILNILDFEYFNSRKWKFITNYIGTVDSKHSNQAVYISIEDKNIEISFGNNKDVKGKERVYNIQNKFSNKQVIYYMIYVLDEAIKSERAGSYKKLDKSNKSIDKEKIFSKLLKSLEKYPEILENIKGHS